MKSLRSVLAATIQGARDPRLPLTKDRAQFTKRNRSRGTTGPFSCIHGWPHRAMTIDQRRGRLPGGAASADGQPTSL
jgi:hypothetical protein